MHWYLMYNGASHDDIAIFGRIRRIREHLYPYRIWNALGRLYLINHANHVFFPLQNLIGAARKKDLLKLVSGKDIQSLTRIKNNN